MTAPRAFLIPTDWGRRPLGRVELMEDCPLEVAAAGTMSGPQRELVSGTAFVTSGTVTRERDCLRWQSGYTNAAGWYWPGGTGTIIARASRYVGGQTNYFFGGALCNDMSCTVSSGNWSLHNSTTGSFGITGGIVCAQTQFNPFGAPFFVAKSIQDTRADMAAYNQSGRILKAFSRTGISGQTFATQQVSSCYFGGPTSAQSRNAALSEWVVLVGGLQLEVMHAVVSEFYGLFFRPAVERTFFVPTPATAQVISATRDSLTLSENAATIRRGVQATADALTLAEPASAVRLGVQAGSDALVVAEQPAVARLGVQAAADALVLSDLPATPRLTVSGGSDALTLAEQPSSLRLTVRAGTDALTLSEPAALITLGAIIIVQASTDALVLSPGGAALRLTARALADALVLTERQATITTTAESAVLAASLDYWVIGSRLQWTAPGAPAHYTMNPARCHYDA